MPQTAYSFDGVLVDILREFPGTTVLVPDDEAKKYAAEILSALSNLMRINQGKRIKKQVLYQAMVEVVADGLKAVERLNRGGV